MNKSLKKFLETFDEKAEIDSKVILSDINYQTFYLWPKELSNELHVVFPFENITSKMIKRKQYLKYIELSDYIILEKNNIFDFNHCIYLEKVKCCCEHLQYFKDVNLLEIIIQEGDTKIQKKDFETFTNLEAITLPKSLNEIEEGTFDNMYNLNNVNGELKWYKYFNISSLKIPEGEKIIRREIFYKFKSLKKVILPNTIEIIEVGAFEESGIEEIDIPNNVKIIPENAFKNCKNLKKIKIPNNVEYIYVTAFTNCNKLKEENIYVYDDELKKFLQKKLKIEKKIINKFDYWKYQSLEDLEISLDTIFESDDIRDIFFERLPFLKKVKMNDLTLSHFLKLNDLNDTNLEKLLKYFMKDRDRSYITPILNQIYRTNDLDLKIKAIEIFVKLGLFDYLIPFNKKQLFNGEEGKRLIDRLKVFGKGVTSFLIEEQLLHDVDVVAELGLNTNSLKIDVNKEYTRSEIKKLTKVKESKISDEFERTLMQFKILLMGDNNANEEDTEMTISAFRNILRLNPEAITIVEKIIQEKRVETDKKFRYIFNQEDTASFFSPKSFIISMNREHNLPSILLHETGHFIHKAFDESRVPDGYIDLVNEIRNNPDFLKIVYEFYLEYNEKMKEVDAEVAKYMEEYDKTITPEREKRVEEFLNSEKRKLVDYWVSKGRSREYIEQLLSKTYTKEEYFRQEREMFKRKINSVIINSRFGNYAQISDILDAIFESPSTTSSTAYSSWAAA